MNRAQAADRYGTGSTPRAVDIPRHARPMTATDFMSRSSTTITIEQATQR